jgi:hypothetical protein
MGDFKCPKITIGNVEIQEQNFYWSLTAGVLPFSRTILLHNSLDSRLQAVPNPTSIRIEVTGGTRISPETVVEQFDGIWICKPKRIDPVHTAWVLADARWGWRGKALYFSYNKTRIKNQKGIGVQAPDNEPAALRKQFDTFRQGRYLPWSVKDGQEPYHMKEIIEIELAKLGIPIDPTVSDDKGSFIVENVEFNGIDIYRGLAWLLNQSRLGLGIKQTGEVYVYSLDWYQESGVNAVITNQDRLKTRPGRLYSQEQKRIRPRKIQVRFERKVETRIVDTTSEDTKTGVPNPITPRPPVWTQQDIDNWRVIGCENVICIPYPTTSPLTGREYNIGEYMPVWEYLSSLELTHADVRENWFTGLLEHKVAKKLNDDAGGGWNVINEQKARQLVSAIRRDYRQLYKIDPWFVDRMEFWEATRVAIINNYDRFAPRSPLFSDFCVIPAIRHPAWAKRTALWDDHSYNWIVNDRDPYRRRPTAGTVVAESTALGVFRISYPPLIDQVVRKLVPSALDPLPTPFLSSDNSDLAESHLASDHTLETILSVVWSTDKNSDFSGKNKFYTVNLDFANLGGLAPPFEYVSNLEYARIPCKELNEEGEVTQDNKEVINEGILEALANAEGAKLINQYLDRHSGMVTLSGFVKIKIVGNLQQVIYAFSPAGGLETTIDMRATPPAPGLEQILNQKQLDFIKQHVARGDHRNEVIGGGRQS